MFSTVIVAVAAATAAITGHHHPAPEPTPGTYYVVTDDAHGDAVATCLTSLGWRGIAGDGMDAIYAPTVVIQRCGGRVSGRPTTRAV